MKVKVKMSATGHTLDECILALQALKEKGVPGDALLGVPLHEQDAILKAMTNEERNSGEDRNYNRTADSAQRDKRILDGARLTFWVEFKQ